ncbi:MAG: hypothetical protein EOP52_05375 [Sphingobacteriales bacterium]|nr:MAG: hypothetical protein EOP52_05375 [Sphingobacteriales bacterium]
MKQPLSQILTAAIDGLLYLSESEAPVALLQWPGVTDLAAAQEQVTSLTGTPVGAQQLQSPADFMSPILKMAVPEDPAMQTYARRWKRVLKKMQSELQDVQVISTPVKDAQVQLYIVGFTDTKALVLHTSAVNT